MKPAASIVCGLEKSNVSQGQNAACNQFRSASTVAYNIRRCLCTRVFVAGKLELSTGYSSRNNRSNTAFHCHVHGHKRYLGQRIRLHERNPCFACFTINNFSWKNGGRQHRRFPQGIIVFAIGLAIGIPINPITLLYALPVMLLVTFGLVSIGLTIASFMGNLEGFGAIQTFVNLPLFFLSGALFPLKGRQPSKLVNHYCRMETP